MGGGGRTKNLKSKTFKLGKLSNRKSNETWEFGIYGGGGLSKNQKSPKFQLGIVQN